MSTSTTEDVLERHLADFGNGDLEAIVSDYTEDAVVIRRDEVYRGHDEIAGMFEELFEEFADPSVTFDLHVQRVEGDHAFIVWEAETPENVYEYMTDTFAIRDGKIELQTFTGVVTPK